MIGVVVWSSGSREKAIIWCEDQATLAYLQGTENLVDAQKWPQPGDLVELDTQTVGKLRHALNVSMLSEQRCPELPQILAQASESRHPHLRLVATHERPVVANEPARPSSALAGFELPRSGAAR